MLIDIIGSTVIFSTLKDGNLEMGATVSTHRISVSTNGKKIGFPWIVFGGVLVYKIPEDVHKIDVQSFKVFHKLISLTTWKNLCAFFVCLYLSF